MIEDSPRTEIPNVPLNEGIYEFVKRYGPVDMREIIVGGRNTGWISPEYDAETIIAQIHALLNTKDLEYTGCRIRVANK